MANAVTFDYCPDLAGTIELPADRGPFTSSGLILFQRQLLPTDPIGTHTLTLTNVVVGSRIAIRSQDHTTTLYEQLASSSTMVIALPVYAPGSPLNDWLVDIRKASAAPFYQRYKTLMTVSIGSTSHYVNQLPDQR